MGVKVETLYAYVSRGLVESQPSGDGKSRIFDARAIDALARRGRPRQSSRSTSLNMLIETRITALSPLGVRYRGLASSELARSHTFEQVAELLWLDRLGEGHRPWAGEHLPTAAEAQPVLLGNAIRVIVANAMANAPASIGTSAEEVAAAGRHLIATVVDSLPVAGDGRTPRLTLPTSGLAGGPALRSTIAGRLWTRLTPRRPPPGMLAVVNAAMVLLADHELAASTLGVRVAASTRANPYAVVCTGLGVLSGSLHGGATRLARNLLDDALDVGAARAVSNATRDGGRIPGYGHAVYTVADPRAVVLLDLLGHAVGGGRVMAVVNDLNAEVARRIDRDPNVDLAIAAMTRAGGMAPDAGEAVMAIARMAGWLAHALEEYGETPLRFRPRASYVGP